MGGASIFVDYVSDKNTRNELLTVSVEKSVNKA